MYGPDWFLLLKTLLIKITVALVIYYYMYIYIKTSRFIRNMEGFVSLVVFYILFHELYTTQLCALNLHQMQRFSTCFIFDAL